MLALLKNVLHTNINHCSKNLPILYHNLVPIIYMKNIAQYVIYYSAVCFLFLSTSFSLHGCSSTSVDPTVFEITIENVSSTPSFSAQNGTPFINFFSTVFALIHSPPNFLFTRNQKDYNQGLQNLAENGDVSRLLQTLRAVENVEVIGIANEPSSGSTGILGPNQSFKLILSATSLTARLSLATSFLQGNDILVMSPDAGIRLFNDSGIPLTGDITNLFSMYDLGTEVNEPPGIGSNQVLRQGEPPEGQVSQGAREDQPVRLLSDVNDGFRYPTVPNSIRISIRVIEFGTNVGN